VGWRVPWQEPSSGKRRSDKTRDGSEWLRSTLTESSLAAARTKNSSRRPAPASTRSRCPLKAVIAVSHSILAAAWQMLHNSELYRDLGGDYFTRQHPD
jgi:transposase